MKLCWEKDKPVGKYYYAFVEIVLYLHGIIIAQAMKFDQSTNKIKQIKWITLLFMSETESLTFAKWHVTY